MAEKDQAVPSRIGPYKIVRRIGAGGMGEVYKAVHVELGRQVALKVLRPSAARNETMFKRFRSEAKASAMPAHENIVIFYEHGEDQGYHYLALEYVKGKDLHSLIDENDRLPVGFSLHVVKQVARALDHAHRHGFVHRDIKPSNILISKDRVIKLTDMGLARQLDEMEDQRITRDGTTVGTVDYMAPEQAKDSHSADIRSDIYALGCTWFHMLAGKPPFAGGNAMDRLCRHITAKVPNLQEQNPKVPEAMMFVIEKMMEKDPARRFQTPAELLRELEKLKTIKASADSSDLALLARAADEAAEDDSEIIPRPAPQFVSPAVGRRAKVDPAWRFIGLGLALLAVILLGLVVGSQLLRDEQPPAPNGAEAALAAESAEPPAASGRAIRLDPSKRADSQPETSPTAPNNADPGVPSSPPGDPASAPETPVATGDGKTGRGSEPARAPVKIEIKRTPVRSSGSSAGSSADPIRQKRDRKTRIRRDDQ